VDAAYENYAPTGDITPEYKKTSIAKAMLNRVKYLAYNLVLTPYAYWLLEVMPFIKLGETRFHPLKSITAMPTDKLIFLKHNIESYEQRYRNRDSAWQHVTKNPSKNSVAILHNQCPTYKKQQLLRLPLLCDDPYLRNEFYALSENRGFGGSKLYADILPKILDMPCSLIADSAIVNAVDFSKRLLTLPTHSNADEKITLYYDQRP
jgi:hypothetical protein